MRDYSLYLPETRPTNGRHYLTAVQIGEAPRLRFGFHCGDFVSVDCSVRFFSLIGWECTNGLSYR